MKILYTEEITVYIKFGNDKQIQIFWFIPAFKGTVQPIVRGVKLYTNR